jgi:hypothetical protein
LELFDGKSGKLARRLFFSGFHVQDLSGRGALSAPLDHVSDGFFGSFEHRFYPSILKVANPPSNSGSDRLSLAGASKKKTP